MKKRRRYVRKAKLPEPPVGEAPVLISGPPGPMGPAGEPAQCCLDRPESGDSNIYLNLLDQFNLAKTNLEMDKRSRDEALRYLEDAKDRVARSQERVAQLSEQLMLEVREKARG